MKSGSSRGDRDGGGSSRGSGGGGGGSDSGGASGGGGGGGSGSVTGGGAEVRLLLHHSQVGCVIGKGGGKIKELREVGSRKNVKYILSDLIICLIFSPVVPRLRFMEGESITQLEIG